MWNVKKRWIKGKREIPDRYRPDTKDGSAVWRQRKSFLLLPLPHGAWVSPPRPPQAVTDKRLLLSCLRYWTSFLPGWPHIDDALSIYSEHCEREHITIVPGPRGSREKSIFCLFSAGSRAHRDSALADISPVTPSNSEPSSAWAGGPSPADFQLRDTSTARWWRPRHATVLHRKGPARKNAHLTRTF